MTVMEQKQNTNLIYETNKFQMINLNETTNEQNHQQISNNHFSRKNSTTGSTGGMPAASNQSLSSNSSGNSYKYDSKFKKASNSSFKHPNSKTTSSMLQHDMNRRASGASITIRVTNSETNDRVEDEESFILKESFEDDDENEKQDLNDDRDRDEGEDTSNSNENITGGGGGSSGLIGKQNSSKKKLKDRRKLQRSTIQQQHQLMCQESEEQIEEELKSKYNSLEEELNEAAKYTTNKSSMNSAFDELFAAAETGNNSISAVVEAKMAVAAAAANNDIYENNESYFVKKNSIKGRNQSFRASNTNNKNQSIDDSKCLDKSSSNTLNFKKNSNNALNVNDSNLHDATQPLTRSCSCKRPGSFKKMKAKNSAAGGTSPSRYQISNQTTASKTNSGPLVNNSRRGTQCSITILETLDNNQTINNNNNSQTGSLTFDQTNQDTESEVCRVRQFNTTNKGSVINRGDSFKRSFKRSNNSISSKKDTGINYYEGSNTLNLPDFQDAYNKSSNNSSNYGLNETSFSHDATTATASFSENIEIKPSEKQTEKVEPKIFLVYVVGSTGVGKNSLIKQFKTSEYRGTYDITASLSEEEQNEGVNVMLDGVESILQFVPMDFDTIKPIISISEVIRHNDAFIVVYAITDKASFILAIDLIKSIRVNEANRPIILVGNKSDLVRKRVVNRDDGRNIALKYGCKFVETSVAINDKVDDLLAGILKQIRLKELNPIEQEKKNEMTTSFIENSNKITDTVKRHLRNYSDANLDDLMKLKDKNSNNNNNSNKNNNNNNNNNNQMTPQRTLSKRLFRSKNKENSENENNGSSKLKRNQSLGNNSIFHKIFNNIFRKKSNLSNGNSVENLFSSPVFSNKSRKA